jgi:hypothetical protein
MSSFHEGPLLLNVKLRVRVLFLELNLAAHLIADLNLNSALNHLDNGETISIPVSTSLTYKNVLTDL